MASKAAYEHKELVFRLSDKLTQKDCENIVYLQSLPKELESQSPLKVLNQLEAQGKTIEDIIKILKTINRHDVAKEAENLLGRSQETRSDGKDSRLRDDPETAVKLDNHFEQQLKLLHGLLNEMISGTKAHHKDPKHLVQKGMLKQSHTPSPAPPLTQSLTDDCSEWEVAPSTHSSTVCNKCLQKSVTAECPKSPLLTKGTV